MAQLNTLLVKGVTRLLQKLYATDIDATGNIDAATFNGFTLNDSVPSGAKFTDTTYEKVNKIADGLVPKLQMKQI